MNNFPIPTKEQVSPVNQDLFDEMNNQIGFVPNLYAVIANSDNALSNYLTLQNSSTSINDREREVIVLVVSQFNQCKYCLSAHTAIAKKTGFTDAQIIEIRRSEISFDHKLDALAKLVKSVAENKGHADSELITNFYAVGFNKGNLIDVIMLVGDRIITNYLYALTDIPVDWPLAPELEEII